MPFASLGLPEGAGLWSPGGLQVLVRDRALGGGGDEFGELGEDAKKPLSARNATGIFGIICSGEAVNLRGEENVFFLLCGHWTTKRFIMPQTTQWVITI